MKSHFATQLASIVFLAAAASAATTTVNTGSLGSLADGTTAATATLNVPGALAAPGDLAVSYSGGANTTVAYNPALNPGASSPFTVEFWANPSASDGDDAVIANRIATGNRSGWVFYQRAEATGWNFRMYNGNGSTLGWDLTGGAAPLNTWSHVVAVWSGTAATLYVNGILADDTNTGGLNGIYNPSTSAILSVGALFDGLSPSTATVDETAFYGTALTAAQIANHYSAAANATPGFYESVVTSDGALLHFNNVPEPATLGLLSLGLAGMLRRRRK